MMAAQLIMMVVSSINQFEAHLLAALLNLLGWLLLSWLGGWGLLGWCLGSWGVSGWSLDSWGLWSNWCVGLGWRGLLGHFGLVLLGVAEELVHDWNVRQDC